VAKGVVSILSFKMED